MQLAAPTDDALRPWYVDFRRDRPEVLAGEHDAPDVQILLDEDVVLPLLTGTLNLETALERGDVGVDGDPGVLARLSELMTSGVSGMETQYLRFSGDRERHGDES